MFTSPPTKNRVLLERIGSIVDGRCLCAKQVLLSSKKCPEGEILSFYHQGEWFFGTARSIEGNVLLLLLGTVGPS